VKSTKLNHHRKLNWVKEKTSTLSHQNIQKCSVEKFVDFMMNLLRFNSFLMPSQAYKEPLKRELESQVAQGILEKVEDTEVTTWLHPIVVVPKKGTTDPVVC